MTLKQSLASAVAFVAIASAAGAADLQPVLKASLAVDQQATGYVEVYSGWAGTRPSFTVCGEDGCETFSSRFNGWALGGAGRANYWISRDVSVQVDAQAEGTSYEFSRGGGRFSTHSYLVGGHWSWRSPQQYLFGVFAAAGDAGPGGTGVSSRHGLAGAEAQWFWNQFTLYAQGGYDTMLGSTGAGGVDRINAWFIRGTGRYFVNPNFLIEGTVTYANGRVDLDFEDFPSASFQTWSWQAKAEWRFPTAPFSVFTKYQGSETKYGNFGEFTSAKVTDNRVLLGLKLHMGDRTLQQTDRAGATLDIVSPLANPTSLLMFSPAAGLQASALSQ